MKHSHNLLLLTITLLLLPFVSATITAPQEAHRGETITIEFPQGETLYKEGNQVSTSTPYTWQTNYTHTGPYTFTLTNNQEAHTITILHRPLDIIIHEPSKNDYNTTNIQVLLETNMPVDFCYTKKGTNTNTLTQQDAYTHAGTITEQEGVHTIEFKCKAGTEIKTKEKTLRIDTTPPTITSLSPAAGLELEGDEAELYAVTNEASTCKYWTNKQTRTQAKNFVTNNWLEHTAVITPGEGLHTYNVLCTDTQGNTMLNPQSTHFSIYSLPTAEIIIRSDKELLRAGTYEVIVTTNKPVTQATLKYAYQQNSGATITLEQETNTRLTGYLVVEDLGSDVGTFEITLEDEQAKIGAQITRGKTFLIKTTPPPPVTSLQVTQKTSEQGSYNELEWTPQQDIEQYYIYRSEQNTVTLDHFLTSTQHPHHIDNAVMPNKKYTYAVLAKDKAGNKGPLSNPQGIHTQASPQGSAQEQTLYEQERAREQISKALIDTQTIIQVLEEERDEQKLIIIRAVALLETLYAHEQELKKAQQNLEQTTNQQTLQQFKTLAEKTPSLLVQRITITGSMRYEEGNNELARARIFDDITNTLSTQEKTRYRTLIDDINNQRTVRGSIILAEILFSDRTQKDYTYLQQEITLPRQQKPTELYVTLPTNYVSNSQDIKTSQEHQFLHNQNTLLFIVPESTTRYEYTFLAPTKQTLTTTREIRHTLISEQPKSQDNPLTGRATFTEMIDWTTISPWYLLGGLTILILLVYYVFMDAQPTTTQRPEQPAIASEPMQQFFTTLTQRLEQQPFFERRYPQDQQSFFTRRSNKPLFSGATIIAPKPSNDSFLPASRHNTILPEETVTKDLPINKTLRSAHELIDNKEYEDARNLYEELTKNLRLQTFSVEERATMNLLYNKLLLYKQISAARMAVEEKNVHKLSTKLKIIKAAAQRVPDTQTQLVMSAKEEYKTLTQQENKLLISHEEHL